MRIDDLLKFAILKIKHTDSPRLSALWIFMEVTGKSEAQLIAGAKDSLPLEQIRKIDALIERRVQGEPMAYILGYTEFYKYRFIVDKNVLIPRPETELIVEEALKFSNAVAIADLGSGSGCIGLSLLKELSQARLWACDISEGAMSVLKQNALALGLNDRVKYSISDVVENVSENEYDLVVSNPPYIAADDPRVEEMVQKYEPGAALFARHQGLEKYELWLPWSYKALRKKGAAIFEFGEGQADAVKNLAAGAGFKKLAIKKDLSGKERVLVAVKE